MRTLAIHTYENFPQMFHIFYLADYSKVSTFFETLGMRERAKGASAQRHHLFSFSGMYEYDYYR